jgi:hypothetical protein
LRLSEKIRDAVANAGGCQRAIKGCQELLDNIQCFCYPNHGHPQWPVWRGGIRLLILKTRVGSDWKVFSIYDLRFTRGLEIREQLVNRKSQIVNSISASSPRRRQFHLTVSFHVQVWFN